MTPTYHEQREYYERLARHERGVNQARAQIVNPWLKQKFLGYHGNKRR